MPQHLTKFFRYLWPMIKLTKKITFVIKLEKHERKACSIANAALSIPRSVKGKVRLKLYGIYRPGNA